MGGRTRTAWRTGWPIRIRARAVRVGDVRVRSIWEAGGQTDGPGSGQFEHGSAPAWEFGLCGITAQRLVTVACARRLMDVRTMAILSPDSPNCCRTTTTGGSKIVNGGY